MGDHDAFFKRIFSNPEYAAGELASVLPPELVAAIDLGKHVLMPGSFVDDAMKQRHTDLLLVPCWGPPAGRAGGQPALPGVRGGGAGPGPRTPLRQKEDGGRAGAPGEGGRRGGGGGGPPPPPRPPPPGGAPPRRRRRGGGGGGAGPPPPPLPDPRWRPGAGRRRGGARAAAGAGPQGRDLAPARRPQRGHPPEACARVGSRASARGPG
ncbi:MAG: Rpn family recombination-promoting nuclease/putative transposase [Sandaracinaceae bacterium]|nr:Rpn family recombination-promoting nuclease/putative transposase [Sandaracinaceae bacterium]